MTQQEYDEKRLIIKERCLSYADKLKNKPNSNEENEFGDYGEDENLYDNERMELSDTPGIGAEV